MPLLTRVFIKTGMICLALALTLGILLAFGVTNGFFPVYIHLLVFGWLTQLIFGVIFWMFPKYSTEKPRGNETLGWWTYVLLNLGLLVRGIAEPMQATRANTFSAWMLVLSAILQFASGLLFVINSWGRVKER
ncbi:MAG: hypothetical protein MHPDNHAH_01990 [Anaerolineales bacterium]|nr:hypothetical protein [Anaerolineales bacterium]WKZ48991.1 MAG: hypothetical protein QY306_06440 [Anaerolineales bacterium]